VLLATAEESVSQVAMRARRLGVAVPQLRALATPSCEEIIETTRTEDAGVVVIDSVQTIEREDVDSPPGSVTQVRECTTSVVRLAKETDAAVVLVGHVTKDGSVAGPKTLEHMVDTVLSLDGEHSGTLRLLRVLKNRFGSCDETGVFVMGGDGLTPIEDASALLLQDRRSGVSGSAIFPSLEGTRSVLVELQALTTKTAGPQPRRTAIGLDGRRMTLALSVLSKHAGVRMGDQDVFTVVAGGLSLREPAGDLALCLALASTREDVPIRDGLVAIGEVGLGGEIRRTQGMGRRLAEAARMGFTEALVPPGARTPAGTIRTITCSSLTEALTHAMRATSEPALSEA
jgi:DNA repair protein RadA/Sms